jgi:hypothetical protein
MTWFNFLSSLCCRQNLQRLPHVQDATWVSGLAESVKAVFVALHLARQAQANNSFKSVQLQT